MNSYELDLTKATNENKHLQGLIEDLPQNVFFNKVLCGCGGTQLALANDNPYVIIVPTTDPILSKKALKTTNPERLPHDILWVYDNIKVETIVEYINKGGIKIFSTYHSLPKILSALYKSIKTPKDFQLLVDEAHMLTEGDDKDFMHSEINYILQVFSKFKSYCFMTATPFPRECFPEQIINIPLVTAKWNPNVIVQTKILAQKIEGKFNDYILNIAIQHLEGEKEGNAYFFYNSVEAISQIAYKLIESGICSPKDIRIIASKKNTQYIKKYVHNSLEIEDVTTKPKKLNFITARSFEGSDIYDEMGVTYVCADGKKKHTRLEIHTKIPQIINRIRNSKFNHTVYLLYRTAYIPTGMTLLEYIAYIDEQIAKAKRQLEELKTLSKDLTELIDKERLETNEFMTKDEHNNFIPNYNAGKRGRALYASTNVIYSSYANNNLTQQTNISTDLMTILHAGGNTTEFKLPEGLTKIKLGGKKANFTKMCKDYILALETKNKESIEFIEAYDEIFIIARTEFGVSNISDHLSAISYQRHRLESRLNIQKACNNSQLIDNIKTSFTIGQTYSKNQIKKKIQNVYNKENVKKTATAAQIQNYFEVKSTTNSKGESCFKIIREL